MISKNKLLSIGKLSIATLLLLATSTDIARSVPDPAAPSDTNAVYPPPDGGRYVQLNWIDNTLDEVVFKVMVTKLNVGTEKRIVTSRQGRGQRVDFNLQGASPGSYRYSVCAQLPARTVCSVEKTFQIAEPDDNPPFTAPTNVRATFAAGLRVSWDHPGGAESFRVYLSIPVFGWGQPVTANGNERHVTIAPVVVNTKRLVKVCGIRAGQERCSSVIDASL